MNSRTKILLEELLKHATGSANETCGIFQIAVTIRDAATWEKFQKLRADAPLDQLTLRLADPLLDDGYDLLDDNFSGSETNGEAIIAKAGAHKTLRFFTIGGIETAVRNEIDEFEVVDKILVAEKCLLKSSAGLRFEQWQDNESETAVKPVSASPRRLVNDMTGSGGVPRSVTAWLFEASDDGAENAIVNSAAARRLALCLPDALASGESGNLIALVRAGRKLFSEVEAASDAIWYDTTLFRTLSEACRWIYLDDRESDVKHLLLISELARVWRPNDTWHVGLSKNLGPSFDAAKIAYRLHVQTKGVDAFKLMSELRKGLADDVRSVASNTASLSSGLWRDAAVAFGVVVLRASTITVGAWLLWVTAGYLLVSCYFTCRSASSAVNGIIANERSFRSLLYRPLLPDNEYDELAGKHYAMAVRNFEWYRFLIVLSYVTVAIALIYAANNPVSSQGPFMFGPT